METYSGNYQGKLCTQELRKCLSCGKQQSLWKGNFGTGYPFGGRVYCCRSCAKAAGCVCGQNN